MKKSMLLLIGALLSAEIQAEEHDSCCCYLDSDPGCVDVGANSSYFYLDISGGANFLQTSTSGGIKSNYKTGYIVGGSLGYRWCNGLRLEGEYAFRRNTLKTLHFFGRTFPVPGYFHSSSYMANLLWDFPSSWTFWKIDPYIGGGIGYDFQQVNARSEALIFKVSKKGFAWQAIAGLSYPLFCNVNLSVEYDFHRGGFHYLNNHSVVVGLMYKFGS